MPEFALRFGFTLGDLDVYRLFGGWVPVQGDRGPENRIGRDMSVECSRVQSTRVTICRSERRARARVGRAWPVITIFDNAIVAEQAGVAEMRARALKPTTK
jgi:hypothetical protein